MSHGTGNKPHPQGSAFIVDRTPGVTYRQLDYWCRKGYFGEENKDTGSGQRRVFTEDHIQMARALVVVSKALAYNADPLRAVYEYLTAHPDATEVPITEDGRVIVRLNGLGKKGDGN